MEMWVVIERIDDNEEQNLYETDSLSDARSFLKDVQFRNGIPQPWGREEKNRFFIRFEDGNG